MNSRYLQLLMGGQGVGAILARGSLLGLMMRVSSALLALAAQLVLARALGVAEFGLYVYAMSWLTVLAMLSRLGMDTGLTRLVAEYRAKHDWGRVRGVLHWAITNTVLSSFLVATIAGFLAWLLRRSLPEGQLPVLWIALLMLPLLSLTQLRQGALRGFRRVVHADLPEMVLAPVIMLVLIISAGLAGRELAATVAIGFAFVAFGVAFLVGSWWLMRALSEAGKAPRVKNTRDWWRVSLPLILVQGMQVILNRLDILMLGTMQGADAAGIYSVAATLASLVIFGLYVVNRVAAPLYSELFHANRMRELQRAVILAVRFAIAVAVLPVVVLVFFGDRVLGLFGVEFVAGYTALTILLSGQVVNALLGSVDHLATMTGHQNAAAAILGIAAAVNIGLNYLLIPRYGIEGAAVATATAIAGCNIAMTFYMRLKTGIRVTVV